MFQLSYTHSKILVALIILILVLLTIPYHMRIRQYLYPDWDHPKYIMEPFLYSQPVPTYPLPHNSPVSSSSFLEHSISL
jgi:hypothetical protein